MLALLGFRVRTVCYSKYLSDRDFALFEDVFSRFGIKQHIRYSTIEEYASDSIHDKGDIREMTKCMLQGRLSSSNTTSASIGKNNRLEVLLIDEVDVFFGNDFYGQTYNPVATFKGPEISSILERIWSAYDQGGRRLELTDIQSMPEYSTLLAKLPDHQYFVDNEIRKMLRLVKRIDEIPYHFNQDTDQIGYPQMDSISYDLSYSYRTVFAYLKESNNMRKKETTKENSVMYAKCGQFSYANISPYRIIGVSGTLQALGNYEKDVLARYGLHKYSYIPSVYSRTNFKFDKADNGIYFEKDESDYYHRLLTEITTAIRSGRGVIVFFEDKTKLIKFVDNPVYRRLSRHKNILTDTTNSMEKEYIINKAATAGQITLSTAIFGRGTDFFCKDDAVEKNGGVHIIQTFLSKDLSEEIQIQGRTARQGKQGSYQLVLLESDLERDFDVPSDQMQQIAQARRYEWLCSIRAVYQRNKAEVTEDNLKCASESDKATRRYFDLLVKGDVSRAKKAFKALYEHNYE